MKRCPKCGGIYADDIQKCDNCKIELVDNKEYYQANRKYEQEERNNKDAYSPPTVYLSHKPQTIPPQVSCPKCGSTQIQAVMRKWSLLTGFLTNKVDRVCLNCKHKF